MNFKKIKLAIVEDDVEICDMFKSYFTPSDEIELCSVMLNGNNVIDNINKIKPDVVMVDLILPNVDGMEILKLLNTASVYKPKVIVFSAVIDSNIINEAYKNGINYYIRKPSNLKFIAKKIVEVYKEDNIKPTNHELEYGDFDINKTRKIIKKLGVPINFNGFEYLVDVLREIYYDTSNKNLKQIYKVVSANKKTSPECVEANIRNAITKAFDTKTEFYKQYFEEYSLRRPTISIFLSTIKHSTFYV